MIATRPLRRFVVLGDVATDVVVRVHGAVQVGSDTPADIRLTGGGAGANVAAWLAEAGGSGVAVHLVGRVGDDAAGRARTTELQAAGVRTALAVDPLRPTGAIVVLVHGGSDGAERTMLPDRGANLGLAPADVAAMTFDAATHLHVSGYALLDAGPRAAALHALALARRGGSTTSVDPASAGPLRALGPRRFLEWVRGVDVLLPNLEEARVLTGAAGAGAAAAALADVVGEAVVTCAAEGAVWSDGADTVAVPAAPLPLPLLDAPDARAGAGGGVPELDVTGAGDAFAAGYLLARADGPRAALVAGAHLAARAVAGVGARPGRSRPRWP